MSNRSIKHLYSISSATSIDFDCCWLSTPSALSNKADKTNQIKSGSPYMFMNQSTFLSRQRHSEIRKNVPRFMGMEGLSWSSPRASKYPTVQSPVRDRKAPQVSSLFAAPCWPSQEENKPWSESDFPFRNLSVRAFDFRAQGFSTPLARRRSSCPPPSPNLGNGGYSIILITNNNIL